MQIVVASLNTSIPTTIALPCQSCASLTIVSTPSNGVLRQIPSNTLISSGQTISGNQVVFVPSGTSIAGDVDTFDYSFVGSSGTITSTVKVSELTCGVLKQ
jgi:hypothetical protein